MWDIKPSAEHKYDGKRRKERKKEKREWIAPAAEQPTFSPSLDTVTAKTKKEDRVGFHVPREFMGKRRKN